MLDDKTDLYMKAISFEWSDIDFSTTDQAKKAPFPKLEKPYDQSKEIIKLTPFEKINKPTLSLVNAIIKRKSHRQFSDKALTIDDLSFLLYCTQGVRQASEKYSLRTVPSAGARHAFETYVFIDRVDGIAPGLYRYLPFENALAIEKQINPTMKEELNKALSDQLYGAAVYFIWTAIPYRMAWRYSFASPKLLALDAGHVCENLYLACEAIGCGTCAIGAYNQEQMNCFLGIDGVSELSIYMAPVGKLKE